MSRTNKDAIVDMHVGGIDVVDRFERGESLTVLTTARLNGVPRYGVCTLEQGLCVPPICGWTRDRELAESQFKMLKETIAGCSVQPPHLPVS